MKRPDFKKLTEMVKRFSKREKLLLYGAAAFIAFTSFDRLIIGPLSSRMAVLDQQISTKEAGIKKNLRILALKDQIKAESLKYTPMVNKIEFTDQDVSVLLKTVENIASKSSVNVLNIKPQGKKELSGLKTYLVSLSCEALTKDIIEFAYDLESSSQLLLITKFQMSPKAKGSQTISCSMSIHKVIME